MSTEEQKSAGIVLSPKASFALGLVGGVLVLCSVGFFILLSLMLKGNGIQLGAGLGAANGAPSPSIAAAAPSGVPEEDQVGDVKALGADDHVQGPKNAELTLIEYSDFQCPFCDRFHPTMKQLMEDPAYKGKVQWAFRHFPLSFHPEAVPSANASECAAEQGKFWEYADGLFAGQAQLGTAFYGTLADELKLNRKKFDDCLTAKKFSARVTADQTSGSAAGVNGTPGTIILGKNGYKKLVPGAVPFEQLKAMVDEALAQ